VILALFAAKYTPKSVFHLVFGLDYVVRVAREFAQQFAWRVERIDANPMLWRLIVGGGDAIVGSAQVVDALRLAFDRDDTEVVAVEKSKHVAMNVEHQYTARVVKRRERQLLLNVIAQGKAILTIIFYVHSVLLFA
jgi:hypothetical protein